MQWGCKCGVPWHRTSVEVLKGSLVPSCSSAIGKTCFLEAKGASEGRKSCIYMTLKSLVRQRLMSKMDFRSKYAIASILSGE